MSATGGDNGKTLRFEEWLLPTELPAAGLRCSPNTLTYWRTKGCPLLAGQALKARPDPRQRSRLLYWKRHVLQIAEARRRLTDLPNEIEEGGFKWAWSRAAARTFKISALMLTYYRRHGHHAIGGQRLAAIVREGTSGRSQVHKAVYYRVDQLAMIHAARGTRREEAGFVHRSDVVNEFGTHFLRRWTDMPCPLLNGRKLVAKRVRGSGYGGTQTLYRQADLDQIRAKLAAGKVSPDSEGWITAAKAAEQFQFTPQTLDHWRDRRCPYLDGGKLIGRQKIDLAADGSLALQWTYRVEDLKLVQARRRQGRDARDAYTDGDGVWLTIRLAAKRFKVPKVVLWQWREGRLPVPGGLTLRSQQVRLWLSKNPNGPLVWVYHEDDLRRVAAARVGTSLPQHAEAHIVQRAAVIRKRAGRRTQPDLERRRVLLQAWTRASAAGVSKKDFCASCHPKIATEYLDNKVVSYFAMRKRRGLL